VTKEHAPKTNESTIRQSQPPEDTQTLLQTARQDRPVVRRTDVQPRQWQNCQISSRERQLFKATSARGNTPPEMPLAGQHASRSAQAAFAASEAGETELGLHGQS
jgi:hypothetical protein